RRPAQRIARARVRRRRDRPLHRRRPVRSRGSRDEGEPMSTTTVDPRRHTRLCDLVGIDVPIVLAGMGSAASPELAAAVSNAGGLGVIGAASMTPEDLDAAISRVESLTDRPFGVDTLLPAGNPQSITRDELVAGLPPEYVEAVG